MWNTENLVNTQEATNPNTEALQNFEKEIEGLDVPTLKEKQELLEKQLRLIIKIIDKKRHENEIGDVLKSEGEGIE
jgi:hypothetical protein